MVMENVVLLEFPSNLGLREPFPGQEPGVKKLPAWLQQHGFHQLIAPAEVVSLAPPPHRMERDEASKVLNADAIIQYAKEQASLLTRVLSEKNFALILGGDCSILLGAALALKSRGNYALFYLDGHTDFMGPDLSETGGLGGMVAAVAAGVGHEKLVNINGLKPYIQEKHVWCVGNREYDEEYERAIINSEARYVSLAMLREEGISSCVNAFLEMVGKENLDGFWLHVDVDVLDDAVMPAVDSRTPGGLRYEEFDQLVTMLLSSAKAAGAEITILDLDLDPSGKYTEAFVQNFTQSFKEARARLPYGGS